MNLKRNETQVTFWNDFTETDVTENYINHMKFEKVL